MIKVKYSGIVPEGYNDSGHQIKVIIPNISAKDIPGICKRDAYMSNDFSFKKVVDIDWDYRGKLE